MFNQTGIDASSLVIPTFTPPVLQPPDWSDTDNWIAVEEDSDMLGARISEINAKISEYQALIDEKKQIYENEKNTWEITKANLELELSTKGELDGRAITKFNSELSLYKTAIDSAISELESTNDRKVKEFQTSLTLWQQEVDSKMKAAQLNNDSIIYNVFTFNVIFR